MNREQQPIDQTPATDLVAPPHMEFAFEGHQLRTLLIDGEPWFVGKDVAEALGYGNTRKALLDHCKKAQDVGGSQIVTPNESNDLQGFRSKYGVDPSTKIIPESDVYRLIIKSKLPSAEKFEKKIMEEILPTIRKTGSYGAPAQLSGPELMAAALIEANATIQQAQLQIAQKDAQLRTQAPLMESYRAHYSMEEVENFEAFADRWGFKNGPLTQVCEERGYLSKASKYRPNDISLEPGEEPTAELGIFRSKRVKTGTGDNQKQRVHATIICGKSPDLARLVLYRFGRDAFAKPKRKSDTRQTDKFNELCVELKAMRDDGYEFDNRLIAKMQIHPDIAYWAEHGTIDGVEDQGQVDAWVSGWLCICPDYALFAWASTACSTSRLRALRRWFLNWRLLGSV
jgi:prophage antirepressor-like protein